MTGELLVGLYVFILAILGALTCVHYDFPHANYIGCAAIAFAMINVVGGFMVTDRMLKMFKQR